MGHIEGRWRTCRAGAISVAMLALISCSTSNPITRQTFASSDDKLDYLLETWNGQSFETLGTVWGKETTSQSRGPNQAYDYERTSRTRTNLSIFDGNISVSTEDITCTASFEVDNANTIVRVTRQGGGKECWNLFKRYEPPLE